MINLGRLHRFGLWQFARFISGSALLLVATLFFTPSELLADQVDFDTDIVPILSKAGCNAAACHGAATGRGGFALSLFGGEPGADHEAIALQLEGRRVNLRHPDESLLLRKATGQLEHGGDQRFDDDSEFAKVLLQWISDGATRQQLRKVVQLKVDPLYREWSTAPAKTQLRVIAEFDDGYRSDVTSLAIYENGDSDSVQVTPGGRVSVNRSGQHTLIVKFLDNVVPVTFVVPYAGETPPTNPSAPKNWIDVLVDERLESLGLVAERAADHHTLVRRLHLDLTGRLPKVARIQQVLESGDAFDVEALIDELLVDEAFIDYWTYQFANILRVRPPKNDRVAATALHAWLRERIANDQPWDQTVRQMLLAKGDSHVQGPAAFYRLATDDRSQAEYVSEVLLGVRLRCANCHRHPLDRWTQDDYHGLASVFAAVERGREITIGRPRLIFHPRTGDAMEPRLPGGSTIQGSDDPRQAFAAWLTRSENPYFARALVNRVWKQLLGRGLVDPVDDFRSTNPASHTQLLDRLAEFFRESDYRLKPLIRLICSSSTYQRRVTDTASHRRAREQYFASSSFRPLSAEVLFDAFSDVLGVRHALADYPDKIRAVQIPDLTVPSRSLDLLGRCQSTGGCESESAEGRSLAAQLHLINGALINNSIAQQTLQLDNREQIQQSVENYYLRALSRLPTDQEIEVWLKEVAAEDRVDQRRERFEDLLWALLNTREFTSNH